MKKAFLKIKARLFRIIFRLCKQENVHYIGGSEMLPPPLGQKEELYYIEMLSGEEAEKAKSVLIERNLRLVVYIAKKFENTGIGVEDLVSIGTIGLIKAINTFNAEKKIKLATYASRCIENEILMYFRGQKKSANDISLSGTLDGEADGDGLSILDTIADETDMLEDMARQESVFRVRSAVKDVLSGREADVIRMRYGLDGNEPLTQREVAAQLNISRSYVSRIEKKALERLRSYLKQDLEDHT